MTHGETPDQVAERHIGELWNSRLLQNPDRTISADLIPDRKLALLQARGKVMLRGHNGRLIKLAFYQYIENICVEIVDSLAATPGVRFNNIRKASPQVGIRASDALGSEAIESAVGSMKEFIDEVDTHARFLFLWDLARVWGAQMRPEVLATGEAILQCYRGGGIPVSLTADLPGGRLVAYWPHGE